MHANCGICEPPLGCPIQFCSVVSVTPAKDAIIVSKGPECLKSWLGSLVRLVGVCNFGVCTYPQLSGKLISLLNRMVSELVKFIFAEGATLTG